MIEFLLGFLCIVLVLWLEVRQHRQSSPHLRKVQIGLALGGALLTLVLGAGVLLGLALGGFTFIAVLKFKLRGKRRVQAD